MSERRYGTAGATIRTIREAMGMTQAELGALFGEGRWYIGQIERDERPSHEAEELGWAIGIHLWHKRSPAT